MCKNARLGVNYTSTIYSRSLHFQDKMGETTKLSMSVSKNEQKSEYSVQTFFTLLEQNSTFKQLC